MSRKNRRRQSGPIPERLPPGMVCPHCHRYIEAPSGQTSYRKRRGMLSAHANEEPGHEAMAKVNPKPTKTATKLYRGQQR